VPPVFGQSRPQCLQARRVTNQRQGQLMVLIGGSGDQLFEAGRAQQAGPHSSGKSIPEQRDHRDPRPQDIEPRRMRIVRKRIERQIGQLQARQMARPSLDSRGKNQPRRVDAADFEFLAQAILCSPSRLTQPQAALSHIRQEPAPEVEDPRVELVTVVERAKNKALVR